MFENFFSFAKKDEKKAEPARSSANALKSEHLNKDTQPIIACIGTIYDFKENSDIIRKIYRPDDNDTIENVDYFAKHEDLVERDFKNAEDRSYVISPVNGKDKISRTFENCTGAAVSGSDKKTGKNISFLSHQDYRYFLPNKFFPVHPHADRFVEDMERQMSVLKEQCIPGTIDAVIFGGNYAIGDEKKDRWAEIQSNEAFRVAHVRSIDLLASKISEVLGFEPVVITGPKTGGGDDEVYYDNENRRLYIIRPSVGDSSAESYLPKDIKKQEEKWTKDFLSNQK
jgi:hypothetical protein